jgi:formylmethanofuran dehydrogenase subunit E
MKAMYNVRRADSNVSGRFESGGAARSLHKIAEKPEDNLRFTVRKIPKNSISSKDPVHKGSVTHSAPAHRALLPVQCFRCGDAFPETDFLYTKKSGLCISCWERKIKVI